MSRLLSSRVGTALLVAAVAGASLAVPVALAAPAAAAPDRTATPWERGTLFVAGDHDVRGDQVFAVAPDGTRTTVGSDLSFPAGVAVDAAGDVYIADTGNDRVVEVAADGTQTSTVTGLNEPLQVAVDAAGNLFILERCGISCKRVVKVTPDGTQTTIGNVIRPYDVAVDAIGNVYLAAADVNQVVKVTPEGTQTEIYGPGSATVNGAPNPTGVAADAFGNVYIADPGNDPLVKVSPEGTATNVTYTPGVIGPPVSVAVDAAGALFIADGEQVLKVAADGTETAVTPAFTRIGYTVGLAVFDPRVASSTVVTADPAAPVSGRTVTFTATVTALPTTTVTATAAPAGTVAFSTADGTVPGCDAATLTTAGPTTATATCTVTGGYPVGDVTVSAVYSGDGDVSAGSAAVPLPLTVTAPVVDHLRLTPITATVAAGGTLTYTAKGVDASGADLRDVTADTTFTIDGAACPDAVCTPPTTAGTYTVTGTYAGNHTAADGTPTGTATLTVTASPTVARLGIGGPGTTIAAGTSKTYTVKAFDQYGNFIGVVTDHTALTSTATDTPRGNAARCTDGVCGSTKAGTSTITATYRGKTVSTTLRVVAADLDHIVLAAPTRTIVVGDTQTYTVRAYDRYDNLRGVVTTSPDTTLSAAPGATCTTADGTCTSTRPGSYLITATYRDTTDTKTLRVVRHRPGTTTNAAW